MTGRDIYEKLLREIAAGKFAKDGKLPSESELGKTFKVSRMTVRGALANQRFRQFQHETILEAITRIRLEEVKHRLLATRAPIARVAAVCGFADASYLMTLFQRKFGLTMREWRLKSASS